MNEEDSVKHAAVLGHPIGHSKSPLLHGAAYAHLGADISYTRIDLDELRLDEFLKMQAHAADAADWVGWSVTMPLKAALVPAMDSVSERVRALGVLNTVVFERADVSAGSCIPRLHAENTDVDGIVAALVGAGLALPAAGHKTDAVRKGSFAVIGSGGTAAAVFGAAAELGFVEVSVYARTPERAEALRPTAEGLGLMLEIRPLDRLLPDLAGREDSGSGPPQAVVSTLPPRAADRFAEELPALPQGLPMLDVAYDPWPSAFACGWEAQGGRVVSGLEMLLHQAVRQVELFTAGTPASAEEQSPQRHAEMVASMRAALHGHTP